MSERTTPTLVERLRRMRPEVALDLLDEAANHIEELESRLHTWDWWCRECDTISCPDGDGCCQDCGELCEPPGWEQLRNLERENTELRKDRERLQKTVDESTLHAARYMRDVNELRADRDRLDWLLENGDTQYDKLRHE